MFKKFKFRGVQLDLARQKETMSFIKDFIDIAADNSYNSLLLYLEGRIKTKSFPYPEDSESYTPEEMKEIVKYAATKDIEVIPCVSIHGHAEQFLKHKELENCAEIRNEHNGRFWGNEKIDLCPAQEETYTFFQKYLEEICDIFPSQYFHMGCDEVYDVGFCEKCASKAQTFYGEQLIYLGNIKKYHKLLSEKLHKRVMIWDDMFEVYRDILPEIPRDIILVCWQYHEDTRCTQGHFSNLEAKDWLNEYDRLGFEYIIAPWDLSASNVRTATKYASEYNPLGGLLTSWEKSKCFLYKSLPIIAYTGRLWNSDKNKHEDEIFREAIQYLFENRDELLVAAMHCFSKYCLSMEGAVLPGNILTLPNSGHDYQSYESMRLLKKVLISIDEKIKTELGRMIYRDVIDACEYNILKFRMKETGLDMINKPNSERVVEEIGILEKDIETFSSNRLKMWNECRKGISPDSFKKYLKDNLDLLKNLHKERKENGILKVRFCLPDRFSAQYCRIMIKYGQDWKEAVAGIFKNFDNYDSFYEKIFFIEKNMVPEAVRIESKGYGGQGLSYIQITNDAGSFIPASITKTEGKVIDPEHVLDNDCKWCFVGEKNTLKTYRNRELAENVHYVEFKLKKTDDFF